MNYFDFYQLPIQFHPDQAVVKQQFYALSKRYHPDFYVNADQEKQDEVLELSTVNNKAFQILKDPEKILPYVLELKSVITEGENYTLPQSFLMEMMDVNEVIMDLQFDPDADKLNQIKLDIQDIEDSLNTQLTVLTKKFDADNNGSQDSLINEIKDMYYRNKYIQRLKQSVAKLS